MMKIYTKTGDSGQTSLFGGKRISKAALRIEAYGTVDELNSILGLAISHNPSDQVASLLQTVQDQLFILGADLATPASKKTARVSRISNHEVEFLEATIDSLETELPPLTNFILPGGSVPAAILHHARTVCRRAERCAVLCNEQDPVSEQAIVFLNRLSDFLFVLARFENKQSGITETPWISKT